MLSLAFAILATSILSASSAFAHDPHEPNHAHLVFQSGALHAHASWVKGPLVSEESILRLEWKNGSTHQPTEPKGKVKVILWMPDMGHGSSPTEIQPVLDDSGLPVTGAYDVSAIYFVMGGLWQVKVQLTTPDGQVETQNVDVELAGHGGHHH